MVGGVNLLGKRLAHVGFFWGDIVFVKQSEGSLNRKRFIEFYQYCPVKNFKKRFK